MHPQEICKEYMESLKCEKAECRDRHPKMCKYLKYRGGCKRGIECDFLHVTPVSDDGINTNHLKNEYNCSGCKSAFPDSRYVKKHVIEHTELFFCLNCDEWIKNKAMVLDQGWRLLDDNGFLRRDV